MSNCTCGRTTRPPLCDGSHSMSEEQYKERTERLAALYKARAERLVQSLQTPIQKDIK